jgi:signal transduction histidine kinase
MAIVKVRGGAQSHDLRRYQVTDKGIEISGLLGKDHLTIMTNERGFPDHHFSSHEGEEGTVRFDRETRQLRDTINSLLGDIATLRAASKDKEALAGLVEQLREANQNLLLATVNAQTIREEAETANRRQNEFLAMLAHELRNPLASIGMAATLLERIAGASPQLPKLQAIIHRQTEQMARLLDDLLDAARVSSGKIVLATEPVLLSDIIERAAETSQPYINGRQQVLTIELPPEPLVVEGDRVRLAQVFSNLLVNASRFTQDSGLISLSASLQPDNIVVMVKDNGAGIGSDVLPHIFNLFTQGPRSLARSEGGLGVGLTVVRSLVQMHGGTVAAASEGLNRGSVFTVTLPVSTKQQTNSTQPRRRSSPHHCRILLIEDNVDASQTMRDFLELEGHRVSCAFDGPSGLAMAQENDYEVVISDLGLLGMDGFALMKALRPQKAGLLTIAVTGYGQLEERTRAAEAGFDHCLVKPVNGDALLSLISARTGALPN